MYTIRREPTHSYYYSQYWAINCQQQNQQLIFHNRQMIKNRQQSSIWSTKFLHKQENTVSLNNHFLKSIDSSNQQEPLPVYRPPCTFQTSLETMSKDGYSCGSFRRSPLSPSSSSCVPDVYSPGSSSGGNCSPPPPSSNLPPPPSEWLH